MSEHAHIRWFEDLQAADVPVVGGKNASLGEMVRALRGDGMRVPDGFAITTDAYWVLLGTGGGLAAAIAAELDGLHQDRQPLEETGRAIRRIFAAATLPAGLAEPIRHAYRELARRLGLEGDVSVAVRSSATADDLPGASFAGQQESFLNVHGEAELLAACQSCYGSLFTDRAISYRERMGFDHARVALSIGVQRMVRSDLAGAGVMVTLDTASGFPDVVLIDAAWGLGETVVQGTVDPDLYTVFKPLLGRAELRPILEKRLGGKERKLIYASGGSAATVDVETSEKERRGFVLTDDEILQLARSAAAVERRYGMAMDLEWAKDGTSGNLFLLQARPETARSSRHGGALRTYRLRERGTTLVTGRAIGEAVVSGTVRHLTNPAEGAVIAPGSIVVTEMTDPDWGPLLERVAGIVTDFGGRTCHAAVAARELGIPAVVGTGSATHQLADGQEVTLSCAEGALGKVYAGRLAFDTADVPEVEVDRLPATRTRIMLNLADPGSAFRWWRLSRDGIGLARMEFIISNLIKIHPMALAHFDELTDAAARREILELTRGYADRTEYFVDLLAHGIATLAASCYPAPAILRLSDFKSNEYAALLGGRQFEPREGNPMLGWRGASRYHSPGYRDGFALECRAIRRAREEIGLSNLVVMVPFCRTPEEADRVLAEMALHGLERGKGGLEVHVLCEIPANVLLADLFAARFDGFSIGSDDLTQLVLGVDRDAAALAYLFDERDAAVKTMILQAIAAAHAAGRKVGICGQAPGDHPELVELLVDAGIDSISLDPGSLIEVRRRVAACEQRARPAPQPAAAAR
jgi:pyruvate,water dikinase